MLGTLPNYIIYIWQGRHANIDEVTASAYLAVELDRQFRDEPVQIRVTMGKEPRTGFSDSRRLTFNSGLVSNERLFVNPRKAFHGHV